MAFVDAASSYEAVRRFDGAGFLSRALLPALRDLEENAWPVADADLIVTARGPGSFTGLRVGMAAAKGLSFVTGLPVVAVSSLAAIASATGNRGTVVAVLDARGGYYFYAAYDPGPPDAEEILPPTIGDAESLAALPYDVYAGPPPAPENWRRLTAGTRTRWLDVWPDATVLARVGASAFRRRGADDVATLKPNYLKRWRV